MAHEAEPEYEHSVTATRVRIPQLVYSAVSYRE